MALLSGILLHPLIPRNFKAYSGSLHIFMFLYFRLFILIHQNTQTCIPCIGGGMTLMLFFAVIQLGFKLSFAFVFCRSSASTGNPHTFFVIHCQSFTSNCPSARSTSVNKVLFYQALYTVYITFLSHKISVSYVLMYTFLSQF